MSTSKNETVPSDPKDTAADDPATQTTTSQAATSDPSQPEPVESLDTAKEPEPNDVEAITAEVLAEMGLSIEDCERFEKLNESVVIGVKGSLNAALAYDEIVRKRLYRCRFATSTAYRKSIAEMSAQYWNNLLSVAELHRNLQERVEAEHIYQPDSESQYRPLLKLDEIEDVVDVLTEVKKSADENPRKKVTAAIIRKVVNKKIEGTTA